MTFMTIPSLAGYLPLVKNWWWRLLFICALILLWAYQAWYSYSGYGLFRGIAVDFGYYYAQVAALWSGDPAQMYDLDSLAKYQSVLTVYTPTPTQSLEPGYVQYPPLFAWLFTPFTWVPPPLGFLLWLLFNFCAALFLACRAAGFFPKHAQLWIGLLVITQFSILQSLYVGQPMILLACAVSEFYLAVRAGREFKAGLAVGLLIFKPQYLLLISLLLFWKRRWAAIAGISVILGLVVVGSLLVAGLAALMAYPNSILGSASFTGEGGNSHPQVMINWRALILFFGGPGISTLRGLLITIALSVFTVVAAAIPWRGAWVATNPQFPAKMALLLLATLVANYHSHLYGEVLLVVPVASLIAEDRLSRLTRTLLFVAILLPNILLVTFFFATIGIPVPAFMLRPPPLVPLSLLLCFAAIFADLQMRGRTINWKPSDSSRMPRNLILRISVEGSQIKQR